MTAANFSNRRSHRYSQSEHSRQNSQQFNPCNYCSDCTAPVHTAVHRWFVIVNSKSRRTRFEPRPLLSLMLLMSDQSDTNSSIALANLLFGKMQISISWPLVPGERISKSRWGLFVVTTRRSAHLWMPIYVLMFMVDSRLSEVSKGGKRDQRYKWKLNTNWWIKLTECRFIDFRLLLIYTYVHCKVSMGAMSAGLVRKLSESSGASNQIVNSA